MSPEPFDSRAKAPPAKRWEKGYGNENGTVGDVGVLSLITNPLNCWAPVPLSQINVSFLENLGQTSGEYLIYRQNLG